jgi:hypothetical protein
MNKLMSSDEDETSKTDLLALYESLNPAKRSLLPLEYQAILRLKGIGGDKNVPTLQKVSRPPSGGYKAPKEASLPNTTKNSSKLQQLDHKPSDKGSSQ